MSIENDLHKIKELINEIEEKSADGNFIYRGEREHFEEHPYNGKISSNLWREYCIDEEHFNIELIQKEMLAAAKRHNGHVSQDYRLDVIASPNTLPEFTQDAIDFEILTEIQHYGGKTNLIDFTTDYLIALFFACDGRYDKDGRVILQKTDQISSMIAHPRNPRHRIIAQKSVFIRPPRGFIEPDENDIVSIQGNLKQHVLKHLRDYHGISTETIYNDLHGFIKNQDNHGDAYTEFYKGFARCNRGDEATTSEGKQEEYKAAINHYNEAIELKSDFAHAYHNRGYTYAELGDYKNAMKDYSKAIELLPNLTDAYNGRGSIYADKVDFENAIKDYDKAIELNPNFAEVYYNRGNAYKAKGDLDKAIQEYTQAIKLKPNYFDAYINRGIAYQTKGDLDHAIQDYNHAIQLKPNDASAYNNRGNAYQTKGDLDQAIQDYNQAIKLNPKESSPYNNRGIAYQAKGDLDQAIQDYNQAIKLNPNYCQAYFNRAMALLLIQEWEKAKEELTIVRNMGEDLIDLFHNDYKSVEDFKEKTGIQLPPDIAALLTPQ